MTVVDAAAAAAVAPLREEAARLDALVACQGARTVWGLRVVQEAVAARADALRGVAAIGVSALTDP